MNGRITFQQLKRKLENLDDNMMKELRPSVEKACMVAEREAVRNCTPGVSPYAGMTFPSKTFGDGAPFDTGRLRASITSETMLMDTSVKGVVGTNVEYAEAVHEGTSTMEARPFLLDAIHAKSPEIARILGEGVVAALKRETER